MKASEIDWRELSPKAFGEFVHAIAAEIVTRDEEANAWRRTLSGERDEDESDRAGKPVGRGRGRAKPSPTELAEALNSDSARTRQLASEGSYVGPNPLLRGNGADAE